MPTEEIAYTGAMVEWVVPAGVTELTIDAQGAQGGRGIDAGNPTGGLGARAVATVPVTPGETLEIRVGGQPAGTAGGYNGGGLVTTAFAGAGGGASDVRRGGSALANRVVAAGGGGGSGSYITTAGGAGGAGGGNGSAGSAATVGGAPGGGGGSQIAGGAGGASGGGFDGSAGTLGVGGASTNGGGGGGGRYGGGGGGGSNGAVPGGGGGGGSSLVTGTATATSVGYREGDGRVLLTWAAPPGAFINPDAADVWNRTETAEWGPSADGAGIRYQLQASSNGGVSWVDLIAGGLTAPGVTTHAFDYIALPSTTAARLRVRAYNGAGYSAWVESATFTIQHNVAPFAPTLNLPTPGSTVDLSGSPFFDWIPQDSDAGDAQVAYWFRRKIAGAPAYEYWNADTAAWQSTEKRNAGALSEIVFPSGRWSNGNLYNWSARTEDTGGEEGPYAADAPVRGSDKAAVTVTEPDPIVSLTSRPVVRWTVIDANGDPQEVYRVAIFTAAQYGAVDFDPATSAAVWRLGDTAGADPRDALPTVDLADGAHRAYVQVRTLGQWSEWAYRGFTVALDRPDPPAVVGVSDDELGRIVLVVYGQHSAGDFPATVYDVERLDGDTWVPVPTAAGLVPDEELVAVGYDWRAVPHRAHRYRAVVRATL